jgi:hypothetical protein
MSGDYRKYPFRKDPCPPGWVETTVGDILLELQNGFSSSKHNREALGIPHLRPMNVSPEGEIIMEDVQYIPQSAGSLRLAEGDNMRNLLPMGRDCNTVFKKTQDLIFANGARRKAFSPYNTNGPITISLNGSQFPTSSNKRGAWTVVTQPNQDEVRTWMTVFNIASRYDKDVLRNECLGWIEDFTNFARTLTPAGGWTEPHLRTACVQFAQSFSANDYRDLRFLRAAFYSFITTLDDRLFIVPTVQRLNTS